MSEPQIAGMEARARGESRQAGPVGGRDGTRGEWLKGYDLMDARISETIRHAKDFMSQVSDIKRTTTVRQTNKMRLVAG